MLQADGTLAAPYEKIHSLTHVVMKSGRFTEKQIVLILLALEAAFCAIAFAVFL